MSYDGEIVIGTRIDSDGLKQDLKNLENEFKGGKVSKRIGKDDIGEPLVEGIKVAINDSGFKVSEAVKRYFEEVEIQKKMGVISEEEYYKKLEELRDKYLAKGTKEWWKYTTAIVQYETKLYEEEQRQIEKIFDELDKNVEKSVSSYERKMEALEDKKDEFSLKLSNDDLLTKISMNIDGKNMSEFSDGVWKRKSADIVTSSLKDLKAEIKVLEEYKNLLGEFSKKEDMPFEMAELLKSYSAKDGIDYMKTVLSMSDAEYKNYIADFKTKKELSDEISKTVYNDEAKKIKEDFLGELSKNFGELDDEFLKYGIDAASKFGESFTQKIGEIMENVKALIKTDLESFEYSFSVNGSEKGSNTLIYNLYGSGETAQQQLQAARMNSELEGLRGGY